MANGKKPHELSNSDINVHWPIKAPLPTPWHGSKPTNIIESTKKAHYMGQISSQSDEWCRKWRGGVRLIPPYAFV